MSATPPWASVINEYEDDSEEFELDLPTRHTTFHILIPAPHLAAFLGLAAIGLGTVAYVGVKVAQGFVK